MQSSNYTFSAFLLVAVEILLKEFVLGSSATMPITAANVCAILRSDEYWRDHKHIVFVSISHSITNTHRLPLRLLRFKALSGTATVMDGRDDYQAHDLFVSLNIIKIKLLIDFIILNTE